MKKFKFLIVISFVILGFWVAKACDCLPSNFEVRSKRSKRIFVGRLTEYKFLIPKVETVDKPILAFFKPKKIYKGGRDTTIKVHTYYNQASCEGFDPRAKENYLVYTKKDDEGNDTLFYCGSAYLTGSVVAQNEIKQLDEMYGGGMDISENSNFPMIENLTTNIKTNIIPIAGGLFFIFLFFFILKSK